MRRCGRLLRHLCAAQSKREFKPPQRLESAYLRATHRAPLPGSGAHATFSFPNQPLVPSFPPVIPDLGLDPITYRDAVTSPDSELWQIAIQQEYDALMARKNGNWCPSLLVAKLCAANRCSRKKMNSDGTVSRYKARLCAKGFTKQYGLDYMDTFSPTVSFTSLRLLFQLVVRYGLDIQQTDVDSAILYADLQEEIYLEQPEGFRTWSSRAAQLVCKLFKAVYWLKQAPFEWNRLLHKFLIGHGLH